MNSIFKYKENNGEVIITGLQEGVAETAIVIPETIGNMPVVEIGPKAFEFSTITDIKIGKNIRKIEKEAFAHCRKLSSVTWNCKCNTIPDNCFYRCTELKKFDFTAIKRVGQYAFGESGLQEVYIPQNIEMIGIGAFNICSELHSVTWNGTCDVIPTSCFYLCSNLKSFNFSAIKKVGQYAFGESGLQEVCLPKNIEIIENEAFSGCSELHSVTWNCKCNAIPANCFYECVNLKVFDFSTIKEIGQYAFYKSGLQEVRLPKNIESIYERAFGECSELQSVEWNCKCDAIPANCFSECSNLTSFNFAGIKKIGSYAFWASGLQEVRLPKKIECISERAFYACSELQFVEWNCKCNEISDYCFCKCTKLKQFDFSGIERIGKHAFEESGLQEVNLPENINVVLVGAFERCGELQSVTWSHKCELIPANCFADCLKLTKFNFANAKKIEQYAFSNSGLQEVRLQKNIESISNKAFCGCSELHSVTWRCQCDVIPNACFERCSNLKQFDLSNVKKIEAYAFGRSGLTSVTLSKKNEVDQNCFAYCNDLEKIEWLSDRNIEKNIFAECKNIKEIFISDSVMDIAVDAFASSPNAEISFV